MPFNNLFGLLKASKPEQPQTLRLTAPVELTAAAAAEGEAPKRPSFAIKGYTGATMTVAGFYSPVVVDLNGLKASRAKIPVLLDHDPSRIVGQGEATITAAGVDIAGTVTGDDADANKVVAHAKNGFEWQASIGAEVVRREFLEAGKRAVVNGREVFGPLIIARESRLNEVSFVAIGADQQTAATVAASFNGETDMPFEQWLKAQGFDPANLSDGQKATLKAAFDSSNNPAPAAKPQADVIKATRDEAVRIAEIGRICAAANSPKMKIGDKEVAIEAHAISEGWTVDAAELAVLRATRGSNAPAAHVIRQEVTADIMGAALAQAGGLTQEQAGYKPEVMEAAHRRFRGRIGLQELLLEAAYANGYTGGVGSVRSDLVGVLRAAFSTLSIPGILSNTANKFLLMGFMGVEDSWKAIAATRNVADFKTVTSYRMNGAFQYEKVGGSGELKHGTVSEDSYTNKAETYGKMFSVTRQDIINDDMGAMNDLPKRIGRGAALKFNEVFWTEFLADYATFWTTGQGNYFEGASSVLSIDSLTTAEQMFFDQTDPDSKPLGVMPKTLLVPNALNVKATQFTRDLEVRDTTASTKYTTSNPHAGKFTPVRSSYLANSSMGGGYSSTAWYLLADPNELAVIEACFLNGQQSPTVESADADFNVLGIQMRGYFDFGVNKQEYRGGVRSKGAA